MTAPNQPRPQATTGVPQPVTALPPPVAAPPPDTLAGVQAAAMVEAQAAIGGPKIHRDPLSRPYTLPSRGMWYPEGHGGLVYISPTRGEQEEVLAGMGEGAAAMESLRHVVQQCVDLNGLPLDKLLVDDWPALLLHLLAYSAGDDRVFLAPICPKPRGCGRASNQTRPLSEMECVELRPALPGQDATWPPPVEESPEDEELAILAEISGDVVGTTEATVDPASLLEPFDGQPLKETGDRIAWRYLRMADLAMAEEFAQRTGSTQQKPGSKLNNVLLALHVVTLNGNKPGLVGAYSWVKRTPSSALTDLRRQIERRSFGYSMRPRFKCSHCSHSFRVELPLDGSLFRGGRP